MERFVSTFFSSKKELFLVREYIYPHKVHGGHTLPANHVDRRALGVDMMRVWDKKADLPLKVRATMGLAEAMLAAENDSIRELTATFTVAYAFLRFITSICDSQQDARYKMSMHQIAETLGLPKELVEMRHTLTHNDPPSLPYLVELTQQALDWLWDTYWSRLDVIFEDCPPFAPLTSPREKKAFKQEVQKHLDTYVAQQRSAEAPSRPSSAAPSHAAVISSTTSALRILRNEDSRLKLFASALERAMLPPTPCAHATVVQIWKPLLLALCRAHPHLLRHFLKRVVHLLGAPAVDPRDVSRPHDQLRGAWIREIVEGQEWRPFLEARVPRHPEYANLAEWLQDQLAAVVGSEVARDLFDLLDGKEFAGVVDEGAVVMAGRDGDGADEDEEMLDLGVDPAALSFEEFVKRCPVGRPTRAR